MIAEALRLSVYLGESVLSGSRLAGDAVMDCFDRHGLTVSALARGIEGFGLNRRVHAQRFPDVSTDLPLLAWAVDDRERIQAIFADIDRAAPQGLLTGLSVGGDALLVLGTGLLGGYTTFSTWMVEAQRLGEDGEWGLMWLYLLGSMLAGLAATGLGWLIGGAIS